MEETTSLRLFGRRLPLWLVGLAFIALSLIAYSPYLRSGFACDDIIFINMMEGAIPYNPVTGFWSAPVNEYPGFTQLWWYEHGAQGAFLRPLPSWALTALYSTFGRNAFPFHLTMAVLHGLVAFSAALLLRRLSGRAGPALLAGLLFLICDDHGMTVAWIATITDLLCALFLNLAFLAHMAARQRRRPFGLLLSMACFLLAMMSKETAAVYPAIVIAYEFFFADRLAGHVREGNGRSPWFPTGVWEPQSPRPVPQGGVGLLRRLGLFLRHAPAWLLPLLVFGGYMLLYRSLTTPMRNLLYLDPLAQPAQYLAAMLSNLPVMFVGLLTPVLPSMAAMMPVLLPILVVAGVALLALLLWALWPYRQERPVWFALLVFVLALLPGLATDAGERLLYLPSVYGLFVVAWLIFQLPFLRHRLSPPPAPGVRILGQVWAWYLWVAALVVPLVLLFIYPLMWIPGLQLPERSMKNSLPLIDGHQPQHVVYLNTNSSFNTFYLPDMYRYHRGHYLDIRLLSSFNGRVEARQVDPQALELRTEGAGWLNNMFARIVRTTPGFQVGDTYATPLFTATVLAVTPDGSDVLRVHFDLAMPLDDPALLLLRWDGTQYVQWRPTRHWQVLNETLDPWAL